MAGEILALYCCLIIMLTLSTKSPFVYPRLRVVGFFAAPVLSALDFFAVVGVMGMTTCGCPPGAFFFVDFDSAAVVVGLFQ